MAIAPSALLVPEGHPVREGAKAATRADAEYALLRAARYLRAGGRREAVAEYIDEWLDYRDELRLREEIERL